MFGLIAAKTAVIAPHLGKLVLTGAKVATGMAVAAKAGNYARENADGLINQLGEVQKDMTAVKAEPKTDTTSKAAKAA